MLRKEIGEILIDFNVLTPLKVADKPFDIGVSILLSNFGERVVMRLLNKTKGIVDFEKLSIIQGYFNLLLRTINRPNDVVLVSGPTGSSKTITLYSTLNKINESDANIITVEDPVEYTGKKKKSCN